MTKIRKKKYVETGYRSFFYIRHELIQKYGMEEAAVIEFLMHNSTNEEKCFPHYKQSISNNLLLSRPTVLRIMNKLQEENIIVVEDSLIGFNYEFTLIYEDIVSRIASERKTYTKIILPIFKELKLNLKLYCLLDSYMSMERSTLDHPFYYYTGLYNIKERSYYNYRSRLEFLGFITVTGRNSVSITNKTVAKFER